MRQANRRQKFVISLAMLRKLCSWLFLSSVLSAQVDTAVDAARRYRQGHEREIVTSFMELLAVPNVAVDPSGLRRNAEIISREFDKRGVKTKFLEVDGAPLVVYGEMPRAGAQRTITFYAHYDGSPLNPNDWTTPPFQPVLRSAAIEKGGKVIPLPDAGQPFDPEWRIYARSAGDDKAPFITLLAALDALQASRVKPTANVKFVFEGEEEAGSPHFPRLFLTTSRCSRAIFGSSATAQCIRVGCPRSHLAQGA